MSKGKIRRTRLRCAICLVFAVLLALVLPLTVFAAERGLGHDRNGTGYTYVIGYCYSGYQGGINTREVFTQPNNYAIWRCPVCGQGGGSTGTALHENQYLPCYAYDIAATGGDTWIRYAKVRHRHNNGSLSNDIVYIPINVAQYSGCYYRYDSTAPSGGTASAPSGWQKGNVNVTFSGGSDTGDALPDWTASPGNYGSGIHHYEYRIDSGGWTGCPVGQSNVTISKGGATTVTSRVVDGAGNAASQTSTTTVYIDNVAPAAPSVTPSTTAWTNQNVTVTLKDNGDTYSGVNRVEYSTNGGTFARYASALTLSTHGRHTVTGRVVDNVGHVSGTASATVQIDKVAPVISAVSQTPNASRTELTLNVTATDADSGVGGYAVTANSTPPPISAFAASMPKVTQNGVWYIWARDNAGNISSSTQVRVVALDSVPPTVTVSTQRTWDAAQNWARLDAVDDNSGVTQVGWSLTANASGIAWADTTASHTFSFLDNGSFYAYAKDAAGNVSEPVRFTVDRIDFHSPDITDVAWETAWTQTKTVTVTAVDTESGMGQYAMTRSPARPAEWQDGNVFENITENGLYYLWARDKVGRVSADPNADAGGEPGPGPVEIEITTIDRTRPVMDAILHSATDNAPEGAFLYPCFNEVDRPELLAHDVGDDGGAGLEAASASGIAAIYYQFVPDGEEVSAEWLVYDDTSRPAMREEFFGRIVARAEDVAGNISEPIDATFLFETTKPTAAHTLEPGGWTNGPVRVDVNTVDAFSGVRDMRLPDGTVVDGTEASFTAGENGVYLVRVRDNAGNVLAYEIDVWNIDAIAPEAAYTLSPDEWTNQPITITMTASDPDPEDGYAPSGIESITLPDGTAVAGDTADFTVTENGEYTFVITDRGGNSIEYTVTVDNFDDLPPVVDFHFENRDGLPYPEYGQAEYYRHDIALLAKGEDADSGIDFYEYRIAGGAWMEFDPAQPPIICDEQISTVAVRVWDVAGNASAIKSRDIVLDKTAPIPSHTLEPGSPTQGRVVIRITANYDICGPQSLVLPDGRVVYAATSTTFEVTHNGAYTFLFYDLCGNMAQYTVTVSNICAPPPAATQAAPDAPKPQAPAQPPPAGVDAPAPFFARVEQPRQETPRLTLLDLLLTALAAACAIVVFLRRNRAEVQDENGREHRRRAVLSVLPNTLTAFAAIMLFFITQPLVWRFRLLDWWTPVFAILGVLGLWLCLRARNEEHENQNDEEESI